MTAHELTISRLINAPRAAVWQAWSDPRKLEQWWLPAPLSCRVVKLDMTPGGAFETLMSEDGGTFQPHVAGCFLDVVAQEKVVFTTALVEGWVPAESFLTITAIITMADEDGGTRYSARVLHKNPEDCQKHAEMGFDEGWGTCIAQLGKLAATL